MGVSDTLYHVSALSTGIVAGMCTLAGIALLIWRRRTTGPVFSATTRNDKLMYAVLVLAIVTGLGMTVYFAGVGLALLATTLLSLVGTVLWPVRQPVDPPAR
jgi:nitrate reductase gamma subunit